MENLTKRYAAAIALASAAMLCTSSAGPSQAQGAMPGLAVAELQYVDTSGEVIDQTADHVRRRREFEASLRGDLARSGRMRDVSLDCPQNACSVADIEVDRLIGKAQAAGASYLLIGAVHKLSTLVQQAKFDIIDLKSRKVVFDRYVTFRGDDDKAWRRAESFVAGQILDHEEW
jgi:Protein of unknown function (DUF2380)